MPKRQLRADIIQDLNELLKLNTISQSLYDKSVATLDDLTDADWKDIENMSTDEASDMVRDIARLK